MAITKNVIITAGMPGVGKSRYADLWIELHPGYICPQTHANLDATIAEIARDEYIVTDYYFAQDYNARKLKAALGCPVEIIVLFDTPENISHRQIFSKPATIANNIDCFHSRMVHEGQLRQLIDVRAARYLDGNYNEYDYDGFIKKNHEYWEQYTRERVEKFIEEIDAIDGYDKYYHHFNLPHGIRIGRDGYARNELTWETIRDWLDWRGLRVLDLCCFHAWFCQSIWFAGGSPVGCDIDKNAIYTASVFAKMNNTIFKLYRCDIDIEFPHGDFDVALLFNVFHHLKNQDGVLRRLKKYPITIFEINTGDREKILKHFSVEHECESPKDGRILLAGRPREINNGN